jgi:hypothetical protein
MTVFPYLVDPRAGLFQISNFELVLSEVQPL